MITQISNPTQIITVDTGKTNIKRGLLLNEIKPLHDHHLVIENGFIKDFVPVNSSSKVNFDNEIDAAGKIILPGLVECHTHTAFAGSRANEFNKKLKGKLYEEIAKNGGGINTTVEAVRGASFIELVDLVKHRIKKFIAQGVTTIEIKSGYGLDVENEIKLLKVINHLNSICKIDIIPTFLGAHTYPKEFSKNKSGYVDLIIRDMLPYISQNKLAKFCDGFCEPTAFTVNEIDSIFSAAARYGFGIKLHTDQFNSIGGIDVALKHNAVSVDHLEVINKEDIIKFGNSNSVAVLLPGVSFFLNYNYAPARELINSNAVVALATDYNPGSSNIMNIGLIMSLAALKTGMTVEEIISAYTINAAAALGINNVTGSIEIGKHADLAIFNTEDYSDLIYRVGENLNCTTIKKGQIIYSL